MKKIFVTFLVGIFLIVPQAHSMEALQAMFSLGEVLGTVSEGCIEISCELAENLNESIAELSADGEVSAGAILRAFSENLGDAGDAGKELMNKVFDDLGFDVGDLGTDGLDSPDELGDTSDGLLDSLDPSDGGGGDLGDLLSSADDTDSDLICSDSNEDGLLDCYPIGHPPPGGSAGGAVLAGGAIGLGVIGAGALASQMDSHEGAFRKKLQ